MSVWPLPPVSTFIVRAMSTFIVQIRAVSTFIVQITAKSTGPIMVPQRCPHPKLWRMYVTFQGQRNFAGVIKLLIR